MRRLLLIFSVIWICANSEYKLADYYNATSILDMVDFIAFAEDVHEYVNFLNKSAALSEGLFKTNNNTIYLGVDSTNIPNDNARNSVQIRSKKVYNHGLFILDVAKMPENVCGTWPDFWFLGKRSDWSVNGKISVIEKNADDSPLNVMSLHSEDGCVVKDPGDEITGKFDTSNCFTHAPDQPLNQGCSIRSKKSDSFGDEFNKAGGGVYATEWTSNSIQIWHFSRNQIPNDIKTGRPNPGNWKKPVAKFYGNCDFDSKINEQRFTIHISFCGDWAGERMWTGNCVKLDNNCTNFVKNNPTAFKNTYWLINSLRVYSNESSLKPNKSSATIYVYIFVPLTLLIAFIAIIIWCIFRHKKEKRRQKSIYALARNILRAFNLQPIESEKNDEWSIQRENVVVDRKDKLGTGAFADVYIGQLIGDAAIKRVYENYFCLAHFKDCPVAVKVTPHFATNESKSDFQQEINFMKALKFHPNLVCFLGYVQEGPLLILEYCANGDLLHFLRANKESFGQQNGLKIKDLVSFSWQISNGLDYFTSLGFVHRDVAARNILLDDKNICKLSDFGLCRTSDTDIYKSRGGKIPVRWMSIESLKLLEYSAKSDVWSFGVLLHELFSLGDVPYGLMENSKILPFLEKGKRLEKPMYCPDEIYEIMTDCFQSDPKNRPDFIKICEKLMQILGRADLNYGYVDAIQTITIMTPS